MRQLRNKSASAIASVCFMDMFEHYSKYYEPFLKRVYDVRETTANIFKQIALERISQAQRSKNNPSTLGESRNDV